MKEKVRFLGLDVHAETIAVAVAEPDGEVRSLGTIPNRAESIRKMIKKLGRAEQLRACYEAGPTGYVVYWQLAELGVQCEVVAPTLVPIKAGDRVKTDRRDAEKLARCYRSGDLTAVWVPDEGSEALRDLVRAREAAKQDQMRARHRLSKFLLRSGQRPPSGVRPWTRPYLIWVAQLRFTQMAQEATRQDYLHEVEHMRERVARLEQAIMEAVKLASPALQQVINDLQALRGIADISAVTIAAELGQVSRFGSTRPFGSVFLPEELPVPLSVRGKDHFLAVTGPCGWEFPAFLIGKELRRGDFSRFAVEIRDENSALVGDFLKNEHATVLPRAPGFSCSPLLSIHLMHQFLRGGVRNGVDNEAAPISGDVERDAVPRGIEDRRVKERSRLANAKPYSGRGQGDRIKDIARSQIVNGIAVTAPLCSTAAFGRERKQDRRYGKGGYVDLLQIFSLPVECYPSTIRRERRHIHVEGIFGEVGHRFTRL